MNTLLRILVIITLLLNGVALWFANALYGKRELLIDRNIVLEDFIVTVAKTFEAEDAPHENTAGNHEARDISAVTLATADITPDRSDFWETYNEELEKMDNKSYSIDGRRYDLQEIYVLDSEGKPVMDRTGKPTKEGAPMDVLLKEVQQKALDQRARINKVRGELTKVRTELEDTIAELNTVKKEGRESLKTIAARDETIAGLESDKARLEEEKTALEEEKTILEDEKSSLQADLDKTQEDLDTVIAERDQLKATIEKIIQTGGAQKGGSASSAAVANVAAGVKGTIARVDNEYNFCIVKVSDETINELLGENRDRELPAVELLVRRAGDANGTVLGKVRIRTITAEANALLCDILSDWKQEDLKVGDEVFYLD